MFQYSQEEKKGLPIRYLLIGFVAGGLTVASILLLWIPRPPTSSVTNAAPENFVHENVRETKIENASVSPKDVVKSDVNANVVAVTIANKENRPAISTENSEPKNNSTVMTDPPSSRTRPTERPTSSNPRIIGDSGYIFGVSVVSSNGGVICEDPWYWEATKEIECS